MSRILGGQGESVVDDTRTRIIQAAIKGVRQSGIDGVSMRHISERAGLSRSAVYRCFKNKEELLAACFTYVDEQAAQIFMQPRPGPASTPGAPAQAVKALWLPYLRFWTDRPDMTVFYFRFRNSERFLARGGEQETRCFASFIEAVRIFCQFLPELNRLKQDLLWLHVHTSALTFARYVAAGAFPDNEETENAAFGLMMNGLEPCFLPAGSRSGSEYAE